jgi:cell division protein FtsL
MATTTAHISCLSGQYVAGRRTFSRAIRKRDIVVPAILFVALICQLTVRVSTLQHHYELQSLREEALARDRQIRQLKLDYAYLSRPQRLEQRATQELGMIKLPPQRIRIVPSTALPSRPAQ